MGKKITLDESDLRRLMAQYEQVGVQRYERARQQAEAEYRHREMMADALASYAWRIPEPELRALMAKGRHHELCRQSFGRGWCTCGIDDLRERDRDEATERDELAGYGLL